MCWARKGCKKALVCMEANSVGWIKEMKSYNWHESCFLLRNYGFQMSWKQKMFHTQRMSPALKAKCQFRQVMLSHFNEILEILMSGAVLLCVKDMKLATSWNIHTLKTLSIAVAESNIANRGHLLHRKMGYVVPLITPKIGNIFTQNFYMQNCDKFSEKWLLPN